MFHLLRSLDKKSFGCVKAEGTDLVEVMSSRFFSFYRSLSLFMSSVDITSPIKLSYIWNRNYWFNILGSEWWLGLCWAFYMNGLVSTETPADKMCGVFLYMIKHKCSCWKCFCFGLTELLGIQRADKRRNQQLLIQPLVPTGFLSYHTHTHTSLQLMTVISTYLDSPCVSPCAHQALMRRFQWNPAGRRGWKPLTQEITGLFYSSNNKQHHPRLTMKQQVEEIIWNISNEMLQGESMIKSNNSYEYICLFVADAKENTREKNI